VKAGQSSRPRLICAAPPVKSRSARCSKPSRRGLWRPCSLALSRRFLLTWRLSPWSAQHQGCRGDSSHQGLSTQRFGESCCGRSSEGVAIPELRKIVAIGVHRRCWCSPSAENVDGHPPILRLQKRARPWPSTPVCQALRRCFFLRLGGGVAEAKAGVSAPRVIRGLHSSSGLIFYTVPCSWAARPLIQRQGLRADRVLRQSGKLRSARRLAAQSAR